MKPFFMLLISISIMSAAVGIGKPLPSVTLAGKNGGYANGKTWQTKSLEGAMHLVLYMDPDKRKNIEPLMKAIQQTPSKKFSTVAVVNLAATWMPNRLLISKLNEQKSNMKRTEYVFDKKRILVKKWGLPDDNTTVIVVNSSGKVMYRKNGKLTESDVAVIMKILNGF